MRSLNKSCSLGRNTPNRCIQGRSLSSFAEAITACTMLSTSLSVNGTSPPIANCQVPVSEITIISNRLCVLLRAERLDSTNRIEPNFTFLGRFYELLCILSCDFHPLVTFLVGEKHPFPVLVDFSDGNVVDRWPKIKSILLVQCGSLLHGNRWLILVHITESTAIAKEILTR